MAADLKEHCKDHNSVAEHQKKLWLSTKRRCLHQRPPQLNCPFQGLDSSSHSRLNKVDAKEPKMGGLIKRCHGKKAWTC